jgi:Pro-kumamolisin, activation domain
MAKLFLPRIRPLAFINLLPIAAAITVILLATAAVSRAQDLAALAGNHALAAEDLAAEGNTAPPYQSLHMEIFLKPQNQAQFNQLLQAQQDPSSPEYHKWLTPAEYDKQFGPSAADVSQISQWLSGQGFTGDPRECECRAYPIRG